MNCQVGDLSGKSKPLYNRECGVASLSFYDPVINVSDLQEKSVVIHAPGTLEKIACGTIICKRKYD